MWEIYRRKSQDELKYVINHETTLPLVTGPRCVFCVCLCVSVYVCVPNGAV